MSARPCEVCSALASSETDGAGAPAVSARATRLRRVMIEERLVCLCDEHAARVELSAVRSIDELRALFREEFGRRSLVGRRSPLDRRMFPPRPEGRRLGQGRRHNDLDF